MKRGMVMENLREIISSAILNHEYDTDEQRPPAYVCKELGEKIATLLEEMENEPCEHERTRMDDGISSCLDCGDRIDTDADESGATAL